MTTLPIKMRQSVYPMISVDQALALVLQETKPLEIEAVEVLSSCGRILAEQIKAIDPFPSFRASIMDGYAVFAPISANSCRNIQQSILAGDNSSSPFDSNFVTYITTGARVPDGANSVVKIEDTEQDPNDASGVRFKYDVFIGANIREIGSDISKDDVIVDSNEKIETAEIGLLASAGVTMVRCYKKPIIGVMSTGDELVEPWEMPSGSQVRDSNRAALIAGLRYDRFEVIDLGIVKDTATSLESTLSAATSKCDVIITSGGVSMGEADLVKPTLEKLGTVHFGRMNMKPGKPTTFAIIPRTGENLSGSSCIVFGLPGNPVSCLVTKSLLIEPCLRRLQGLPVHQCMPPQIAVTVRSTLKLDPERPEYHRAHLSTDLIPTAESTGNQRSSRLLSMRSSNALLCLPQGGAKTVINQGEVVTAIVTGQLSPPSQLLCYHKHAVSSPSSTFPVSTTTITSPTDLTQNSPAIMRVGLLTISDRVRTYIYN